MAGSTIPVVSDHAWGPIKGATSELQVEARWQSPDWNCHGRQVSTVVINDARCLFPGRQISSCLWSNASKRQVQVPPACSVSSSAPCVHSG